MGIQYSQDRTLFVTASNGKGTLWSAINYRILTRVTPASGSATDIRINKNNTQFAVATSTSNVYIYSTISPYGLISSINAAIGTSNPLKIDFSYDGLKLLVCGGSGSTAKIYDLATNTPLSVTTNNVVNCKFAPDGNWGTVASNNKIDYWPITGGTSTWQQNVNGCVDLDIDGGSTFLVAACGSNRGYSMATTTPTAGISYTGGNPLRTTSISADTSYAAFGGDQKVVMFASGSSAPTFTPMYSFPTNA